MIESRYIIKNAKMNEHHLRFLMMIGYNLGKEGKSLESKDILVESIKSTDENWPTITVRVRFTEIQEPEQISDGDES